MTKIKPNNPWQLFFKRWLKSNDSTPGHFAAANGLSCGTTANWYWGKNCPHWNDAPELAAMFKVSEERIISLTKSAKGHLANHRRKRLARV